jgi:hypothetical protein
MLAEDERNHIRDEEIFRREVRRQLEAEKPTQSRRSRVWKIVNSTFVIWLLSSVVLGLLGWGYSSYQARHIEQTQRTEIRRKLIAELTNRTTEASLAISTIRVKIDHRAPDSPNFIVSRVLGILDGQDITSKSPISAIYPEYQNRSFISLITELEGLVTGDEKITVHNAADPLIEIKTYSIHAQEFGATEAQNKELTQAREANQANEAKEAADKTGLPVSRLLNTFTQLKP